MRRSYYAVKIGIQLISSITSLTSSETVVELLAEGVYQLAYSVLVQVVTWIAFDTDLVF